MSVQSPRSVGWVYASVDLAQTKFPVHEIDASQADTVRVLDREDGLPNGRITLIAIKTQRFGGDLITLSSSTISVRFLQNEFQGNKHSLDIPIPPNARAFFLTDLAALMERHKLSISNKCRAANHLPMKDRVVFKLCLAQPKRHHIRLNEAGLISSSNFSPPIHKISADPTKVEVSQCSQEKGIFGLRIHYDQLSQRERTVGCLENIQIILRGSLSQNPSLQTTHLFFPVPLQYLSDEERVVCDWLTKTLMPESFDRKKMAEICKQFALELREIHV